MRMRCRKDRIDICACLFMRSFCGVSANCCRLESLQGVPATHDSAAHFTYTYLFDRALVQRQFPVRWIEWVRDGHGQPLFSFYQPGLYYLTQITHLAVPSLSRSLMLTVLAAWCLGIVVHVRVAAAARHDARSVAAIGLRVLALPRARRVRARRVSGIRRDRVRAGRVVEPRSFAYERSRCAIGWRSRCCWR